jgi:hypothetical protein
MVYSHKIYIPKYPHYLNPDTAFIIIIIYYLLYQILYITLSYSLSHLLKISSIFHSSFILSFYPLINLLLFASVTKLLF